MEMGTIGSKRVHLLALASTASILRPPLPFRRALLQQQKVPVPRVLQEGARGTWAPVTTASLASRIEHEQEPRRSNLSPSRGADVKDAKTTDSARHGPAVQASPVQTEDHRPRCGC